MMPYKECTRLDGAVRFAEIARGGDLRYPNRGVRDVPNGCVAACVAEGEGGIMVTFVQDEPNCSAIFAWPKPFDAYGTGSTTGEPVVLAPDLRSYLARLRTEDQAKANAPDAK